MMNPNKREVVGVIPAAGRATRLGRLPCSKEILPLGIRQRDGTARVRVAIESSLNALRAAGINRAVIVVAPGKADIADYLGDGSVWGLALSYLELEDSPGAPWSVDAAREVLGTADTALAFPDIQFRPEGAIKVLVDARAQSPADIYLALVPSTRGDKVDLVVFDDDGRIDRLMVKPGPGHGGWTWVAALWGTRFTEFLHRELSGIPVQPLSERYVGEFVNRAMAAGLTVRGVPFPDGDSRDIGTPGDLAREWLDPTSA